MLTIRSTESPARLLPLVLDRVFSDNPERWLIVPTRGGGLARRIREQLLAHDPEHEAVVGAGILPLEDLVEELLNHDPMPPTWTPLTRTELRALAEHFVQEVHGDSEGELFQDRVDDQGRVDPTTLTSLVRLIEELEIVFEDAETVGRRLLEDPRGPSARAHEIAEFYQRVRTWMAQNQWRGPLGKKLNAAVSAERAPLRGGADRVIVCGVDGSGLTDAGLEILKGLSTNPRVDRVEVAMVLPHNPKSVAWSEFPNKALWERWKEGQPTRHHSSPVRLKDFDSPRDLAQLRRDPFRLTYRRPRANAGVRALRLPDTTTEAEWVAREIKREVLRGRRPGEIAVIAQDMGARAEAMARVMEEHGIPTRASYRKDLRQVPALRAVRTLAALAAGQWSREAIIGAAESPYVHCEADVSLINAVARTAARSPETHEAWVEALRSRMERIPTDRNDREVEESEQDDTTRTIEALAELQQDLESLTEGRRAMTPVQWRGLVRDILKNFEFNRRIMAHSPQVDVMTRSQMVRVDIDGVNAFLDLLDEWVRGHVLAESAETPMTFERWEQEITAALEDHTIRISSYPEDAVHLMTPKQASYLEWESVYVIGLAEGVFPKTSKQNDPLLTDEERKALSLPTAEQRSAQERLWFHAAVGTARKRLTLTTPAADDRGRALVTSPFLSAMQIRLRDLEIEQVPARSVVPRKEADALRPKDVRILAAEQSREAFEAKDGERIQSDQIVRRWLESRRGRWVLERWEAEHFRAHGRHDPEEERPGGQPDPRRIFGGVIPPELLPERIRASWARFSPSDIEALESCPFRFFAKRLLKLPEDEAGGESHLFGSLQHEVLEALYRELAEQKMLPPRNPREMARAIRRLRELSREVLATRRIGQGQRMLAIEAGFLVSALDPFVRRDLERMRQGQSEEGPEVAAYPDALEQKVERPVEGAGQRFRIRGVIDRLEVVQDSRLPEAAQGQVILRDYKTRKTKRPTGPKDFLKGRSLQLPLYAAAASGHHPKGIFGIGEVRTMNDKDPELLAQGSLSKEGVFEATDAGKGPDKARSVALEKAGKLVERARSGDFRPAPATCRNCPYPRLCRAAAAGTNGWSFGAREGLPMTAPGERLQEARDKARDLYQPPEETDEE